MNYLRLIRFPNLIIIIATQCIIMFGFFKPYTIELTLSILGFIFLVTATTFIAAGGYIINDIIDVTADKINKPKRRTVGVSIDPKRAKLLYYLFTFIGIGFGFTLAAVLSTPLYFLLFAGTAFGLYMYSRFLRKIVLVGNVLVSFTIAIAIAIVPIFELLPIDPGYDDDLKRLLLDIILDISIAAFLINLIREIVKDVEDIQGDYVARYRTLPIILGAQRTARIASVLSLITLTLISWYTFTFLYDHKITVGILFFGVIAPLGYVATQLWEANKKSEFTRLSFILKIIMLVGIIAIPLISYTLEKCCLNDYNIETLYLLLDPLVDNSFLKNLA
ncbi:geranylgeranylglycerol-phosphate geranylgeranyltransferase [uncultured Dokdonia sp.]|uniref:geranylgeranylglycerol-phosphate geranylgeranyltransferase n=1 Tax=uncultured Dokdonia sp. TaxID=575653 RepID=UPI002603DBEE|nr:geranylgeranylglycerol-phosphate geranylgeranyltransferase [uncultured Dokdonia sp.]